MNAPRQAGYSSWPHRLALAVLGGTAALVFVGGLVTTYKAGLAVPDWPTTFGYGMFTYPLTRWLYGPWQVFIEHGHRLLGALVGLATIALAATLQWKDPRPWVRRLGWVALALVIFQGTLGGMRVILRQQTLALVHGCTAPVFFSLVALLAVATSRRWHAPVEATRRRPLAPAAILALHRLRCTLALLAGLVYVQIVLGAVLRHFPEMASWRQFAMTVMFHLTVALLVLGHVVAGCWLLRRLGPLRTWLLGPACLAVALVLVQLVLGTFTWGFKYAWPEFLGHTAWAQRWLNVAYSGPQVLTTTAHVLTGSLILATSVVWFARACRLYHACCMETADEPSVRKPQAQTQAVLPRPVMSVRCGLLPLESV